MQQMKKKVKKRERGRQTGSGFQTVFKNNKCTICIARFACSEILAQPGKEKSP